MSAPPVWSESLRVRAAEVGESSEASPAALCSWLQEAAGNHATALGWAVDQLAERGITWVLARLHLRAGRPPRWREEVRVETWPSGVERLYATREFRILDTSGDELAIATSGWLLLDLASRRPVRPPAEIAELGATTPPRLIPDRFEKLAEASARGERRFEARFGEVDLNRHVNNVAQIAWLIDALPHHHLAAHRLAELEVEFRAEAALGDEVASGFEPLGDGAFRHRVGRVSDGREITRGRTVWRSPEEQQRRSSVDGDPLRR